MPELPEVETTRRGLAPHLAGRSLAAVAVREARLRWPVPDSIEGAIGRPLVDLERRAKYLLFRFATGTVLVHLGMSGSLRLVPPTLPPGRHDHVDLAFTGGLTVRLTDPRRFGAVLWAPAGACHPLLARLGIEPLDPTFDGQCLVAAARRRPGPVKSLLMDARVVVGVGNIYASEALFRAAIHPRRPARRVAQARYEGLARAIVAVLSDAIAAGGTTLRDFVGGDGRPGYFEQALAVYGRAGEPCLRCGAPLRREVIAARATYFCVRCQR